MKYVIHTRIVLMQQRVVASQIVQVKIVAVMDVVVKLVVHVMTLHIAMRHKIALLILILQNLLVLEEETHGILALMSQEHQIAAVMMQMRIIITKSLIQELEKYILWYGQKTQEMLPVVIIPMIVFLTEHAILLGVMELLLLKARQRA
jgi:hypothetical protein